MKYTVPLFLGLWSLQWEFRCHSLVHVFGVFPLYILRLIPYLACLLHTRCDLWHGKVLLWWGLFRKLNAFCVSQLFLCIGNFLFSFHSICSPCLCFYFCSSTYYDCWVWSLHPVLQFPDIMVMLFFYKVIDISVKYFF